VVGIVSLIPHFFLSPAPGAGFQPAPIDSRTPPSWQDKGPCNGALRCIDVLALDGEPLGVRTDDQHSQSRPICRNASASLQSAGLAGPSSGGLCFAGGDVEEQMRTKHLAASGYACYAKAHVASADAYPAQEGR
jgi:hypothetical protein